MVWIDPEPTSAYAGAMRWDALFSDLEAQLAASERMNLDAEIADRMRAELAGVELSDRLRGSLGLLVGVQVSSGSVFEGRLTHAGSEALVLQDLRHQILVPYAAAVRYVGLSPRSVGEPSLVRQRLGLASALRGLARDRTQLSVLAARGAGAETSFHGVIDRVGRDHLDLAATEVGADRRPSNVRQMVTLPIAALAAVKSARIAED